jgi:hypothetical protein
MRPTAFDSNSAQRAHKGSVFAAVVAMAALAAVAAAFALRPRLTANSAASATASRASTPDYKTLPVYFEQNRGQTDPRVQYLSHGPGYTVFLTRQGTVLALRKVTASPGTAQHPRAEGQNKIQTKLTTASVWINLAGARPAAQVEGIDPLPGRVNYFIGNNPSQWHTGIPTYARVKYQSVYPGIDLVYYGTRQALEYDLIAAPGADPGVIRLEIEGAENTRLDSAGNLVIGTAAGDLTMRSPRVYQDTASGERRTIAGHYVISTPVGSRDKRNVTLALAEHDPQRALVIDPELVYSTYIGGNGDRSGPIQGFASLPSQLTSLKFSDAAISLALGPGNSVFVTGLAYSSDFPATPGAFQSTNQATPNTTPNGFVAKFDTTKAGANSLVYSTYLGGKGCSTLPCTPGHDGDQGTGIAVDTAGNAYVSGLTYSTDFPNPSCGSFGKGNNQGAPDINNGFAAELNTSGSGLIYSCFIHGSDGAPASDVAIKRGCSSNCTAYIVGNTTSDATTGGKPDFPILNAFQPTNPDTNSNSSGYVTVINGGGSSLMYSSFLGGSGTPTGGESLTRIAVDTTGRAYITGASYSSNYPTKNAFQSSNNGFAIGVQNAVVSEINPSGSGAASLLYSTYLGGSGLSIPFVGSFGDIAAGIALDSSNHIYVAGVAVSSNFPTNGTKKAYQPNSKAGGFGGANGFVSELAPGLSPASQLVYSTYIGGAASLLGSPIRPGDAATDVAVDSATGKIYLTGGATSTTFPIANTCSQMSTIGPNDQADAFVSILDPNVSPPSAQLQFSTYLGGSNIDVAGGIARDSTGKIYVAGVTFSGDFPVTKNAFQFGNNAFAAMRTNAFVTELDPSSTVCPTPFPSPSITPTPTGTKPVATPTPTKTVHRTPTPTATATSVAGTPHISSIPGTILVGDSFNIVGTGFTPGSKINFFVATASGPVNAGPLTPTFYTSVLLTVAVPDTILLGQGFVSVQVVNTDTGFKASNLAYALLQGSPIAGIPTIKSIDGVGLAATSSNPSFATNNVEIVVPQGTTVRLGGTAFDVVNGVGVDLFCACPGGKLPTFFLNPGNPGLTATQISIFIPAKGSKDSPPTGPGSFVVSNAGASKSFAKKSNAVSVPIGARIHALSVSQSSSTITVNGSGFSTLTTINFFNKMPDGSVENLGGLMPNGEPEIPLTFVIDTQFKFAVPSVANKAPSYVQALNPPFVPFTSSGNDPGGAFTLK